MDNFCWAIHEMEHLTERPAELKQEIFKLLFESAEIATFTPEERAKYQLDMTTERDIQNQIAYAREEGKSEGLKATAMKMIEDHVPVLAICKYTGLSMEEVERLQK